MRIHPTAIIDPSAELHETVEVGPYSVIDKNVKIGEGTKIDSNVRIYSNTIIGKKNSIHHGAAIGGEPQDLHFDSNIKSNVTIGDRNRLREFFTVHRAKFEGKSTVIGNDCFLMENAHVAHDSYLEDGIIMVHCAATSGHVHLEKNSFVSGLSAIHQFCRIGTYAMIAGCSKIVKDIPPYAMSDGNPASVIGLNVVGLKRAGFKAEVREKIKHAYKLIYHSGLNTSQALEQLRNENDPSIEVQNIINFFANSERGVTDHR